MEGDNVIALRQPHDIADPLTEALRNGARGAGEGGGSRGCRSSRDPCSSRYGRWRPAPGAPRAYAGTDHPDRHRAGGRAPTAGSRSCAADGERIRFSSTLLPRYARRTKSLDALLPVLYLRGISTGDMQEALAALLGRDAPNLSPAVLARLKSGWQEEFERWKRRDLSARRYVYIWADGVYLQARMEPDKQCILVLIGATPEGKKELIGL
jgi:putative transposase